jgi:hypothetical protein
MSKRGQSVPDREPSPLDNRMNWIDSGQLAVGPGGVLAPITRDIEIMKLALRLRRRLNDQAAAEAIAAVFDAYHQMIRNEMAERAPQHGVLSQLQCWR